MKLLLVGAAALAVTAGAANAKTLSDVYSSYFALGDSLSDIGNLPISPLVDPYYDAPGPFGRQFSNGPVFTDILDDQFSNGLTGQPITTRNYAFGGARAVRVVPPTPVPDIPDLADQLGLFLADLAPVPDPLPGTPEPGAKPLVSLWFGANDIFGLLGEVGAGAESVEGAINRATAAAGVVVDAVKTISAVPGFNTFAVLNLPDLGQTPAFNQDAATSGLATGLTNAFNAALAAGLTDPAIADEVISIDVNGIFAKIVDDIAAGKMPFGLTIAGNACLDANTDAFPYVINGDCGNAVNEHVFWDGVHPTGVVHAELARIVEVTAVPLPAGLPLLGAGLVAFGALRLRKRPA